MWFFLAFAVICFTIIVLFRMFIDMRRMEQQHNRLMQSDRRDYERFIEVATRELPKAALPDFSPKALNPADPDGEIGYYQDDSTCRHQATERSADASTWSKRWRVHPPKNERRDRMNRNW